MDNQDDQNAEEHSTHEPEAPPLASAQVGVEVVAPKSGSRRAFGFLGSLTFWWRLGVGVLLLGAGVLVGLGIAWFIDDNRDSEYDEGLRGGSFAVRVDPSGEWSGEEGFWSQREGFNFPPKGFKLVPDSQTLPEPGDWWQRDHRMNDWFERRGEWLDKERFRTEGFEGEGIYIPYEALEILEGLVEQVEQLLDRVAEYMDEGRFGPRMNWPEESDDKGLSEKDQEYSSGGKNGADDEDSREGDRGFWDGDDSPLEGFGFPFGDILPGLAFLEDCELDFQSLLSIVEDLEDLEDLEDFEDFEEEEVEDGEDETGEDFEGFFQQIEELLDELCEVPSDN